jgi:F-type H+-transporting ATPase subunit k
MPFRQAALKYAISLCKYHARQSRSLPKIPETTMSARVGTGSKSESVEHTPVVIHHNVLASLSLYPHFIILAGTEAIHAARSSTILGRAIKTEYLTLGTLLSTAGLSYAAASGGSKAAPSGSKQTLKDVKESVKFDSSSK